jgi:hypothetical protein
MFQYFLPGISCFEPVALLHRAAVSILPFVPAQRVTPMAVFDFLKLLFRESTQEEGLR